MLSLSTSIWAQDLDQDCNRIALPPECERLVGPVTNLNNRIAHLQERLKNASPAMKAGLIRNIEQLNTELNASKAELVQRKKINKEISQDISVNNGTIHIGNRTRDAAQICLAKGQTHR